MYLAQLNINCIVPCQINCLIKKNRKLLITLIDLEVCPFVSWWDLQRCKFPENQNLARATLVHTNSSFSGSVSPQAIPLSVRVVLLSEGSLQKTGFLLDYGEFCI